MARFKIASHDDRIKIVGVLANSGYKVWIEQKVYVCVEEVGDKFDKEEKDFVTDDDNWGGRYKGCLVGVDLSEEEMIREGLRAWEEKKEAITD